MCDYEVVDMQPLLPHAAAEVDLRVGFYEKSELQNQDF